MTNKYILIKNQRYYYYNDYPTWVEALKVAKYFRHKNQCRYFILKTFQPGMFSRTRYQLYLNKVISLW